MNQRSITIELGLYSCTWYIVFLSRSPFLSVFPSLPTTYLSQGIATVVVVVASLVPVRGPVVILLHFVYIICCYFVPSPCAHYACIFIYLPLTFFVSFHFILCATFYYHFPFAFRCICLTPRKILWKFFFFLFFILFRFGWSWGTRKVDSHSRGSDNYFCIQTTRKTYQPVALPTVPLSLSLPREVLPHRLQAFENRFLIFSVLSLVFGSFFFLFSTLRYFFFMLSLSSCPAALLCLVAFISI